MPKKKGVKKPQTVSGDGSKPPDNGEHTGPTADTGSPDASTPDVDQDEFPDGPAVDGDSPDPEAVDKDGDEGENAGGAINDDISGKTVQGVSLEPHSRLLPGAKELTISFNETTDTLRVLCTSSGQIKLFWRGSLHDLP